MKKYTFIALIMLLSLSLLVGCSYRPETPVAEGPAETETAPQDEKDKPAPAETSAPAPVAPVNEDWIATDDFEITDAIKDILNRAMERIRGVVYDPVAYVGRQNNAGTNYAVICKVQMAQPTAIPYYAIIHIHEDTDGSATVTETLGLAPNGQLVTEIGDISPLVGGWEMPADEQPGMDAFEKATADLSDVMYSPIRVIGTQLVAGHNYCVLSQITDGADAKPFYALVTVYEDLDGNATVADVVDLSPSGLPENTALEKNLKDKLSETKNLNMPDSITIDGTTYLFSRVEDQAMEHPEEMNGITAEGYEWQASSDSSMVYLHFEDMWLIYTAEQDSGEAS